jgi:SAM-dependent methyltransferase
MRDSWAKKLFIDNVSIYQPVLESGLKKAPLEVQGLIRLFRKFRVPKGGKILDASCGIGRHSIHLAKSGYDVVGYDPSQPFLRRAQQLCRRMGLSKNRIRFYCGRSAEIADVLLENGEDEFDAIISMDYSFGYSGREDDLHLFRNLRKLGNQKCVLVIETGNKNFWFKHFQYYFRESFPSGLERFSAFSLDRRKGVLKSDWEFYRKLEDRTLKYLLSVRVVAIIYSKESLANLLNSAGWRPVSTFENIQHPRRVSDSVPMFFTVAKYLAPGVR